MFIFLFLCSLLVPLSMTFLGYTWKDNPPKDRQGISGYRTTMSRINDETCVNVNIKMIKKWKIKMYIFQDLFLSLCFHKGSFFF